MSVHDLANMITNIARKNTKLKRNPLINGRYPDWEASDFSLNVKHRLAELFSYENKGSKFLLTCDDSLRQDMIEVMDKSGAYDLEFVFYPNKAGIVLEHDKIVKKQGNRFVRPGDDARKSTGDAGWITWFNEIFQLLGEEVHLIPDTNVLMRHYYSNYLHHILSQTYPNLQVFFKISRLSIMEVENKYNRVESKDKDRRVAFHTAKEILTLQQEPNALLPEVSMELLTSFAAASGKKFADAWVRKEVASYIRHLRETRGQDDKAKAAVFVTCDLMNALAASAEGLNTLYIVRLNPLSGNLTGRYRSNTFHALARLLLCAAIQFGECDCVIKAKSETQNFKLTGIWPGKNMIDWISDTFLLEKKT